MIYMTTSYNERLEVIGSIESDFDNCQARYFVWGQV